MIETTWNEACGSAHCIITDNSNGVEIMGTGSAYCHPNDEDFISQRTGEFIAQTRAEINILQKKRNYDLKPGLMALKHLHATMKHSGSYNPTSYESKRLMKEIKNKQEEIYQINCAIEDMRQMLKQYLDTKEKMYQDKRKANIE